MASQTFALTAAASESETITIGAGEALRVRFAYASADLIGKVRTSIVITANGFESEVPVDERNIVPSGAVAEGDVIKLRAEFGGATGTIEGILESFAS